MNGAREATAGQRYLDQGERAKARPATEAKAPPRIAHRFDAVHATRGFTLGGHRLLSLYRGSTRSALTLTGGKRTISSWQKYLGGSGGQRPPPILTGRDA